ncbi:YwmB family TATA-box binding protein [Alicyclobacillus shizuokensis]|uniref:YwmB family TATA-box binding protein n=1 Tax=Alicyclobacillus shizuokensis TaxID=392014 RepID=UPI00083783BB|nr:YwmB family TATA-box binding protein [Alicyclobacillus shizuokensis]MCL6627733.1 YwmB family TATA-box binding protein [Alicyclobacillus shizuokensis]
MRLWLWLAAGIGAWALFHQVFASTAVVADARATSEAGGSSIQTGAHVEAGAANEESAVEARCLTRAYAASGAHPLGFEVHNWSEVNQQFMRVSQLSTMADRVRQEMAQHGANLIHMKTLRKAVDGEAYVAVEGETKQHARVSIILSSLRASAATAQTVLVIRADEPGTDLDDVQKRVSAWWTVEQAAVESFHASPQISACISGYRDGRILNGQQGAMVSRVLESVSARRVEGIHTGSLTSVSAYSPLGSVWMTSDGHKMNLQVAVHYDSYHHYTHVVIGTPIITVTY